ncbi:hypothetical protein I308_105633 [Cryptococcus tetragattii IND107]|uniref:Uncharacterized protein n=1 Tax=Cryptococcus tetragattii IND107 TaxID=1296105 RepID=A0ABR3BLJ0_9TREE
MTNNASSRAGNRQCLLSDASKRDGVSRGDEQDCQILLGASYNVVEVTGLLSQRWHERAKRTAMAIGVHKQHL